MSMPYWAEIFIIPVYAKPTSQSAKQSVTVKGDSITKYADHKLFRPRETGEVDSVTTYRGKFNSPM